jgi:hypothetical protein
LKNRFVARDNDKMAVPIGDSVWKRIFWEYMLDQLMPSAELKAWCGRHRLKLTIAISNGAEDIRGADWRCTNSPRREVTMTFSVGFQRQFESSTYRDKLANPYATLYNCFIGSFCV